MALVCGRLGLRHLAMEEQTLQNNGQFDEIYERMVELRIACLQYNYPQSEALYSSIEEYEEKTGRKFWE